MTLLPVSHRRQQQQSDCLAACAAMALDYLQQPIPYNSLLHLLHIDAIGAPFRNLRFLQSLNLIVTIGNGDLPTLRTHLHNGRPLIVAVDTGQLAYWNEATDHAVLVVGVDARQVYLLDPDSAETPQPVPLDEFELAWLEKDYLYAVLEKPAS